MNDQIGFIGIGNMGGAMAKAIAKRADELKKVVIYDVNQNMYQDFIEYKSMVIAKDLNTLVKESRYIVLSIKPQYYEEVCAKIKEDLNKDQVIVTVSPSHTMEMMKKLLGEEIKIIRTMPNTPAQIGEGVTAYTYLAGELSKEEIDSFLGFFNSFGRTLHIEEKLMPAVVATTGSSPAYAYMFIEAMADAAVSLGLPRSQAYEMSALAIKGACEMVLQTRKHPGELKDAVTSPGGTTIEAVKALEATGLRNSIIKGMMACYDKACKMSHKS